MLTFVLNKILTWAFLVYFFLKFQSSGDDWTVLFQCIGRSNMRRESQESHWSRLCRYAETVSQLADSKVVFGESKKNNFEMNSNFDECCFIPAHLHRAPKSIHIDRLWRYSQWKSASTQSILRLDASPSEWSQHDCYQLMKMPRTKIKRTLISVHHDSIA